MVLENLVSSLLDKYLGGYIDNLDTKRLKIDLWNGNVNLENLYLKSSALADLNLPVTISIGYLKKLSLQVPWSAIYAQPTKVTIEGLYLLVVPKIEVDYDEKREAKELHDTKMREVLKIEQLRKKKEEAGDTETNNSSLIEKLQLQVLRNLELTIENIHIVYEDRTTKADRPFSFGITLDYFTLHTTGKDWEPTILKEDTPLTHKLGQLSALSIYWNTDIKTRSKMGREEAIANMRQQIAKGNKIPPDNISYILRPLSMKAKMKVVMKPQQDGFKRPMFDVKLDLDEISLNLNRDQYLDLLDLLEFQDYLNIRTKYRKYEKQQAIEKKESSHRKKWLFAYDCILNEHVRSHRDCYKWTNIKSHLNRSREYRALHVKSLTGTLTPEEAPRVIELEKSLDVLNLTYLRRSAEIEAKKRKDKEPKTWWGSVSNWWSGAKAADEPELDLKQVISGEEKEKLFEAIGYDGNDAAAAYYPKEFIDLDVGVQLRKLDIGVWSRFDSSTLKQRIVTRVKVPNTSVIFQRRPAAQAHKFALDLGSFQVFGISTDLNQSEDENNFRPILAEPLIQSSEEKLLKIEYEINPIDETSDYRIRVLSQSLAVKYNAPTINKLVECFQQDKERKLEGIKRAAYSTYSDVKSRSLILMNHNLEKIKVLDIDIDLQSAYFLLPTRGVYEKNASVICMDFGHLTVKRTDKEERPLSQKDTTLMTMEEAREKSFTRFKLQLDNVQLIYAHESVDESWRQALIDKNTSLHIIKPMVLELDLEKCIYSDDAVLPAWKLAGQIPNISVQLSNRRIFQLMHHVTTVPFPKSNSSTTETVKTTVQNSTADTLAAVEAMKLPSKTKKEENLQLTMLQASFTLKQFELIIDEANDENDQEEAFLRILLYTLSAHVTWKTFDKEFQVSLSDLIVFHEQFIGQDNEKLRLISAEFDEGNAEEQKILVTADVKQRSRSNPAFQTAYGGIETEGKFDFKKLVVILKLEALLSILRFQDSLMKSLGNNDQPSIENKADEEISTKSNSTTTPTTYIQANFEEFQIILESKEARVFDIQVGGIEANVSQARDRVEAHLVLSHLKIFDPYKDARYQQIVSQQSDESKLLCIDFTLFNYKADFVKPLDAYDCDVFVRFAKANIVFLYKHIGAFLNFLDALNITTAALELASTRADAAYQQVQKLQQQAFKAHLDVLLEAPNIIIPTNSFSDEALTVDLGQLTLKTSFNDDPVKLLVETQQVQLKKISAARTRSEKSKGVIGQVNLIDCADLNVMIHRLLYPSKVTDEPGLRMNINWESVRFHLTKDDLSCVMKVLMENFSENLRDQTTDESRNEKFRYLKEKREKEDDRLREAVVNKQKESETTKTVNTTMKMTLMMNQLSLILYLGESNLKLGRIERDSQKKLADVQINMFEARFRQSSDSSYNLALRIKNFLIDDLRQSNKAESLTRMMDIAFNAKPNDCMFLTTMEFKPAKTEEASPMQNITMDLRNLYICISFDFLFKLQDFFMSSLPTAQPNAESSNKTVEKKNSTPTKPTEMKFQCLIEKPQVILLEDQQNPQTNCLVLDVR